MSSLSFDQAADYGSAKKKVNLRVWLEALQRIKPSTDRRR